MGRRPGSCLMAQLPRVSVRCNLKEPVCRGVLFRRWCNVFMPICWPRCSEQLAVWEPIQVLAV
eukprot:12431667-Alexandrium_andersonii.AAC.1